MVGKIGFVIYRRILRQAEKEVKLLYWKKRVSLYYNSLSNGGKVILYGFIMIHQVKRKKIIY